MQVRSRPHLRLTLLAPDSVEPILAGAEPDGLSLESLYWVPVDWEEQRQVLRPSPG